LANQDIWVFKAKLSPRATLKCKKATSHYFLWLKAPKVDQLPNLLKYIYNFISIILR
jgi:hypothetical protein